MNIPRPRRYPMRPFPRRFTFYDTTDGRKDR